MRLKKVKIIRRYSVDIWNFLIYKKKKNNFANYFKNILLDKIYRKVGRRWVKKSIYRVVKVRRQQLRPVGLSVTRGVVRFPRRFKSKYGKLLVLRKCLFFFYGVLKKNLIKVWLRRVRNKKKFGQIFINYLESRLCVIVYRMNFVKNVLQGKDYVKKGFFMVNKRVVYDFDYLVQPGDIIEVVDIFKKRILKELRYLLKRRVYPMLYPQYLEVDFRLLLGVYLMYPLKEQLFFPFKVNKNFFSKYYYARY